jgi:hypothetical protein
VEKGAVKLVVFNGKDFGYWKNQTHNYLLSQGHATREIVQEAYVNPVMLDNATHGELQRYENNYKALNLITTTLGRNVYGRVAHIAKEPIIGSIRLFLRNLVNLLMIALLGLSLS